eukprot:TRINITY_DN4957_c0_g1_i5.p1 TRINITY_DN4957_c0_g1~~TRINITY_DN4957_c0_g1_i5.p1  ORF type:complete len:1081 (-),score=234.46 TRINITY_DN4957_c0_g1_i5:84-3326(-)
MECMIPPQLLQPPRTVVALVNLKENHHLFIPPLVGEEEPEGARYQLPTQLEFRVISADLGQPFPKKKERKNSQTEAYVPPGILQSYWLTKHTCQLPAVMAVLFQWDDEGDWRQRETHIRNQMEAIKYNHRTRSIKYLVVLVQRKASQLDPAVADERLRSMKQHSDLDSKNMVVVSLDSLAGSMPQLRNHLADLAIAYYNEEAARIKAQMKRLNPATQRSLFVRYHFKVAFMNEFKHDLASAVVHYKHAYDALASMKHPLSRIHEFKSMAEILTFKVVQLQLASQEVCTQHFFRLIRDYRQYSGDPRRVFEHFEWLSRQYTIMAQLMAQQPQEMIPPHVEDATFFYEGAFANAMERKQWANRLCTASPGEGSGPAQGDNQTGPLEKQQPVWVGQRATIVINDPDMLAADISELEVQDAIRAESSVDHSAILMRLLGEAIEFVSKRNLKRTMMSISIKMGTELFAAQQYQRAKDLLEPVAAFYRKECWWSLLTPVTNTCSLCSWHLSQVRDYIWDTLELLPACMNDSNDQKHKMQQVVMELLDTPAKYKEVFGDYQALMPICYAVNQSFPLVSARVQWSVPSVHAKNSVKLAIAFTNHAEHPLPVAGIDLTFSDPRLNQPVSLEQPVLLEPESEAAFCLVMDLVVIQELTVEELHLHLGHAPNKLRLDYALKSEHAGAGSWNTGTALAKLQSAELNKGPSKHVHDNELCSVMLERPMVQVLPPPATLVLEVEHQAPVLLFEDFNINLSISTNADQLSSGRISFGLPEGAKDELQILDAEKQVLDEILLSDMLPGTRLEVPIWLRATVGVGTVLTVSCGYTTHQGFNQLVQIPVELAFKNPVHVQFHFLDAASGLELQPATLPDGSSAAQLNPGSNVIMLAQFTCSSQHALQLLSITPELSFGTASELNGIEQSGLVLEPNDGFSASWLLVPAPNQLEPSHLTVAHLELCYKRGHGTSDQHNPNPKGHGTSDQHPQAQFSVPIPAISTPKLPVEAYLSPGPEQYVCGEAASMTVHISNLSSVGLKFLISVDMSQDFLVSGPTRLHTPQPVSYTHLRAHETPEHLVCRLLLEKKKKKNLRHSSS